jgi:HEAT repeat protein
MEHLPKLAKRQTIALVGASLVILGSIAIWYFYFTVRGLTQQLDSSSQDTRCAAAKRLAKGGSTARSALPKLESMLDNTECMEFGHDALPEWVDEAGGVNAWFEVAKKGGLRARRQAFWWVGLAVREHPERREELIRLFAAGLEDEDGVIRHAAVSGIGSLRAGAYAVTLQRLLNDPESEVRKSAVEGLDKTRSLDGLALAASSPDEDVRVLAIQHLRKSPDDFPGQVRSYNEEITDPELSESGRRDWARRHALPDPRDNVSYGKRALPILVRALEDPSERVSNEAVYALGSMHREALPALEDLEKIAFNSANVHTRLNALTALSGLWPESRPILERAANDPEPRVREEAAFHLNFQEHVDRF